MYLSLMHCATNLSISLPSKERKRSKMSQGFVVWLSFSGYVHTSILFVMFCCTFTLGLGPFWWLAILSTCLRFETVDPIRESVFCPGHLTPGKDFISVPLHRYVRCRVTLPCSGLFTFLPFFLQSGIGVNNICSLSDHKNLSELGSSALKLCMSLS